MTLGIRDRIRASSEMSGLLAAKDITGLAAALNAQDYRVPQERFITGRTVLAECEDGESILRALEAVGPSSVAVKWMLKFLEDPSGMDIGHPRTFARIDALVSAGVWSAPQGEQLKALALQPVLVTQEHVAREMFHPNGEEK
jgi:hypothetical protein